MAFDKLYRAWWAAFGRPKVPDLQPLFRKLPEMVTSPATAQWVETWRRPDADPIPRVPKYGAPGADATYNHIAIYSFVEEGGAHWQLEEVVSGSDPSETRRRFLISRSVDGKEPYVPQLNIVATWRGEKVTAEPVKITVYAPHRGAPTTTVVWSRADNSIDITVPAEHTSDVAAAVRPIIGDPRHASPEELTATYTVAVLPPNMRAAAYRS